MLYVGLDPGKKGGLAWMDPDGQNVHCKPLPEHLPDFIKLLMNLAARHHVKRCALEIVHSRPGQGAKSLFTFGQRYGWAEAALVAMGYQLERVRPQDWQKPLGLITGKDLSRTQKKNKHKARAQEMWPALIDEDEKPVTITHATADALLICEWWRRANFKEPEKMIPIHRGGKQTRAQINSRHKQIREGQK